MVGSGRYQLYTVRPDGSDLALLLEGPGNRWSPDWSAAHGRVAFCVDGDIYVADPEGAGLRRLTDAEGPDIAPAWSPDGARIAFMSRRDGGAFEVYVMDADGANQTRLTFGGTPPDG